MTTTSTPRKMTRVNCVPVQELSDKHLLAEWYELPRVIKMVEKQVASHGKIKPVPDSYRMGSGHMQFFADKLGYVLGRLVFLSTEMRKRGYNPNLYLYSDCVTRTRDLDLLGVPNKYWSPTEEDMEVNRHRLRERDPEYYDAIPS